MLNNFTVLHEAAEHIRDFILVAATESISLRATTDQDLHLWLYAFSQVGVKIVQDPQKKRRFNMLEKFNESVLAETVPIPIETLEVCLTTELTVSRFIHGLQIMFSNGLVLFILVRLKPWHRRMEKHFKHIM
jgi:hypothetical protein